MIDLGFFLEKSLSKVFGRIQLHKKKRLKRTQKLFIIGYALDKDDIDR